MSTIKLPCSLPLRVTPALAHEYENIALAVRDQTLTLYKTYLQHGRSTFVNDAKWKSTKRRDGAEVFVGREKNPPTVFLENIEGRVATPETVASADFIPQVLLRLIGQMPGLLTDAVYGAMAPSETAMTMRSTLTGDDVVDHYKLLTIRPPTAEMPLTHTTLKWSMRSTSMASLIKARDLTQIESTGFTQILRNGVYERVGYIVSHSVNLHQLPPLDTQGLVRSKVSTCTLFRQSTPTTVEIFSTTAIAPGGDLPPKLTVKQAVDSVFTVCKLTECAAKRKLVWMQVARSTTAPKALAQMLPQSPRESAQKAVCDHCSRPMRSAVMCEICEAPSCSKCMTSQKLWFSYAKHDLRVKSIAVCKACTTSAQHSDYAPAFATYEFVQKPMEAAQARAHKAALKARRSSSTPSDGSGLSHSRSGSTASENPYARSSCAPTDISLSRSSCAQTDHLSLSRSSRAPSDASSTYSSSYSSSYSSRTPSEVSVDDVRSSTAESFNCGRIDEADDIIEVQFDRTGMGAASQDPRQQKLQLWQQMTELCIQAENTYHQTKQAAVPPPNGPRFEQRY